MTENQSSGTNWKKVENQRSNPDQFEKNRERELLNARKYGANRFGLQLDEVVWYNSGFNYDRIVVTNQEAANKVSEAVKECFVENGLLAGMQLGGQVKSSEDGTIDVTC